MLDTKPHSYLAFKHLNKRVTIIGYPPVIGAILIISAIMIVLFSITFRSFTLFGISIIYLPLLIWYTIKNRKAVKENKLEVITLLFFENKRKVYSDDDSIINKIRKSNGQPTQNISNN